MTDLISVRELYLRQKEFLPFKRSYKTLLKYVREDYKDVFKPVMMCKDSGTRYYVKEENVIEFKRQFLNNEL